MAGIGLPMRMNITSLLRSTAFYGLVTATLMPSGLAQAAPYDGKWSVVVVTEQGELRCLSPQSRRDGGPDYGARPANPGEWASG